MGLDPFLGLIPGIGDRLTNLIGTIILTMTAYLHVTQIILARMSLNLLISGVVGAIPITGDLFSIWFRSHATNVELLRRAAAQPYRETQQAKNCTRLGLLVNCGPLLLAIIAALWIVVMILSARSISLNGLSLHHRSVPDPRSLWSARLPPSITLRGCFSGEGDIIVSPDQTLV